MSIKLLSYNVQSWDVNPRRIAGIIDLIKRHDPDVICFQEVTILWYSILRKELGDKYTFTGRDRFYGDKEKAKRYFERNSIAFKKSKFKSIKCRTYWLGPDIYNRSRFEGAQLNRVFTTVILKDKNNKKFEVISTHFDDRFPDIRAKQGVVISNFAKEQSLPLFLMGDFNSTPSEDAYKSIKDTLIDVGEEFGVIENTWHGYGDPTARRIDFAFRNRQVKVKSFVLVKDMYEGLPPSDHYPIECVIDFSK